MCRLGSVGRCRPDLRDRWRGEPGEAGLLPAGGVVSGCGSPHLHCKERRGCSGEEEAAGSPPPSLGPGRSREPRAGPGGGSYPAGLGTALLRETRPRERCFHREVLRYGAFSLQLGLGIEWSKSRSVGAGVAGRRWHPPAVSWGPSAAVARLALTQRTAALLGHQCRRSLPRMQSGPTGVGFLAYKLPLCKIKQVLAFIVSFLLDARYWWLADACVSGCCLLR